MLQQILHAVIIVSVGFAQEHPGQTVRAHLAAFHQHFQCGVIIALRRVVEGFVSLGSCASLQKQTCQFRMLRNCGRSIEGGFKIAIFILCREACIRISAGIQQRRSRAQKSL